MVKCLPTLTALLVHLLIAVTPIVAHAAPILFDFEAVATDVTKNEYIDQFPGLLVSDTIGGLGAGGTLAGSFSITDQPLEDSSPDGNADTFHLTDRLIDIYQRADDPQKDVGFSWQFGDQRAALTDASHASNPQSIRVALMDSPQGDSISITLFRGPGIRDTYRLLQIFLTDPTGTAFPGVSNLTGSYDDALNMLTGLDLGRFSEARVRVETADGRRNSIQQIIVADITGFSIREVPEPTSLAILLLGLLLIGLTATDQRRVPARIDNR